jgi:hypothetical protein
VSREATQGVGCVDKTEEAGVTKTGPPVAEPASTEALGS